MRPGTSPSNQSGWGVPHQNSPQKNVGTHRQWVNRISPPYHTKNRIGPAVMCHDRYILQPLKVWLRYTRIDRTSIIIVILEYPVQNQFGMPLDFRHFRAPGPTNCLSGNSDCRSGNVLRLSQLRPPFLTSHDNPEWEICWSMHKK